VAFAAGVANPYFNTPWKIVVFILVCIAGILGSDLYTRLLNRYSNFHLYKSHSKAER
jgi:hypothetical protein